MSAQELSSFKGLDSSRQLLGLSARTWFVVTAFGQLAFIVFIVGFYYTSTLAGDYPAWNNKPLIDGYKDGDSVGNTMFAFHVILAAVMTVAGLIQLIPQIRSVAPRLHRMSGRIFVTLACALAVGGLWLVWVRGTYLSPASAISVSLNGVLILLFSVPTMVFAVRRKIAKHRLWAMRLFLVASGVWFVRIGITAWPMIAQGRIGMNQTMSGPMDNVITFGSYLIPLAIFEVYHRATLSSSRSFKTTAAMLVCLATAITVLGVYGTIFNMWLPQFI